MLSSPSHVFENCLNKSDTFKNAGCLKKTLQKRFFKRTHCNEIPVYLNEIGGIIILFCENGEVFNNLYKCVQTKK